MKQLHKRMNWQGIWQVMEHWHAGHMGAQEARRWLGISRSRLYTLKTAWLNAWSRDEKNGAWLYRRERFAHRLSDEARSYLEEELRYMKEESPYFKGH